jgi:GNAT superfamily N-acetyltransferase
MSGAGKPVPPTPVVIREAVFADLPGIIHVFMGDETGQHGDVWSDETQATYEAAMRAILASDANTLFVVEQAGQIIGTFQVTLIPGLVARGRLRAKLESVHVRLEHRGQGLGSKMVVHALAFAKAKGAGMAELTSNKRRKDAHRFYEKLGFERSHEGFKKTL